MRSFFVRPIVWNDVSQAAAWYEQNSLGRGDQFRAAVSISLDRIASNPQLYAAGIQGVRKAPTNGYAYIIYYRIEATMIDVFAVIHNRRRSAVWKERLNP